MLNFDSSAICADGLRLSPALAASGSRVDFCCASTLCRASIPRFRLSGLSLFCSFSAGVIHLLCIFAPWLGVYISFTTQSYLIAGRLRSPFFCVAGITARKSPWTEVRSTGACSALSARGLLLRWSKENSRCTSYWILSTRFYSTFLWNYFQNLQISITFVF